MATQLEGNITLGGTNYAADVKSLVITGTREVTETDGTFADSDKGVELGSASWQVTINFNYDEGDATNVWSELWTAFNSATGDLAFTANPTTGATSATNPQFSGTLKIADLDSMGTVGDEKVQSKTFRAISVTRATA